MFEALLGEEVAKEMSKKGNKADEFPYLDSRAIKQLSEKNFNRFLTEKDAALVFFYKPECLYCNGAKPHVLKAAKAVDRKSRQGYGVVDCSKEQELCAYEKIHKFPTLKLYVGGKFHMAYTQQPNYKYIKEFVDNAPEPPSITKGNKRNIREDL